MLHNFELIAGLKTNMEKTQAFMRGKHMKRFNNNYNLNWTYGPIHILGLLICKTEVESIKYNFELRIKMIRTIFNMWKQKIYISQRKGNSDKQPRCTIFSSSMYCIRYTRTYNKRDRQNVYEFLWNGKVNTIARTTMIKQIEQGSLKLKDMTSKTKSLKMTWVKHAINNPTSS